MTKREQIRQLEFLRQARQSTLALRTGNGALMKRLREVLREKGIDPSKTVLIGIQVDGLYAHAGGEFVLPNGDAVGFGLDWDGTTIGQSELAQWFVDNTMPSRATGRAILDEES